jgi:uncharacterized protein
MVCKYNNRTALRDELTRLLLSNNVIFQTYGPHSATSDDPLTDAAEVWRREAVEKIVPTNRRIVELLDLNRDLLTPAEHKVAADYRVHADAFEARHLFGVLNASAPRFPEAMNYLLKENAQTRPYPTNDGETDLTSDINRYGDWMQTFTGRAFWPLDPQPADIDIKDIAHALSMLCRYGGHTSKFYSVAEHCVLMSRAVEPENALWALLHDATEAYMGDMVRPLKRSMPMYAKAENDLMLVICVRFGLPWGCPTKVKEADNRILVNERTALMTAPPLPWAEVEDLEPLAIEITGWDPLHAKQEYLRRYMELVDDRLVGGAFVSVV